MLSKETLWEPVADIVRQCGQELFDIEMPGASSAILRVYIWNSNAATSEGTTETDPKRRGVTLDQCAAVSKKLSAWLESTELAEVDYMLEVSSPGVNRKLRRPEHFSSAVGEHVKLKFRTAEGAHKSLTGTIEACLSDSLKLMPDGSGDSLTVPLGTITEARVDFLFT